MINKIIANLLPYFPPRFVWLFSKKYIAGKTIDDAIKVSKELNAQGILTTVDLLGEFITNLNQANANKLEYLSIINRLEAEEIKGNYSLKPSFFGLLIDEEICYSHIRDIVALAAKSNNFVRIDMEDSSCVDKEIKLFRRLYSEFPGHVGLVIQAYLKRTHQDIMSMLDLQNHPSVINYRLCKGIYIEPKAIALKKHDEINKNYLDLLKTLFEHGIYVGIATHDKQLVNAAFKLIDELNMQPHQYEFQMLYGVTPELREAIVRKNHRMRVYVPFGKDWFGYSTRRLKENPNMATHIIKSLFVRG